MPPTDAFTKIQSVMMLLRQEPLKFLRAHQQETMTLEYKAAFEYDLSLARCPLMDHQNPKDSLNPLLSQKIFLTLTAFANSQGGMLIMGVAEKGAPIVEKAIKHRCRVHPSNGGAEPCYNVDTPMDHLEIGNLRVVGLDTELALNGWGFDKFQRHLFDRFSMGKGKHKKKSLDFKQAACPCQDRLPAVVKITVSESVNQHIDDIFAVRLRDDKERDYTIGAVVVRPAPRPIYLTLQEGESNSFLYALPLRKTGRTELENDLRHIETYLFNRFKDDIAEEIAQKLAGLVAEKAAKATTTIRPEELPALTAGLAANWQAEGWAFRLVESYARQIKPYLPDMGNLAGESGPAQSALFLMVSLYYGSGWELWTPKNKDNIEAAKALLEVLHMPYWWRTRFRALYALQFMNQDLIANLIENEKHRKFSDQTLRVLQTHVPNRTVAKFLIGVFQAGLGEISKKAGAVLAEVAVLWNDSEAGVRSPL